MSAKIPPIKLRDCELSIQKVLFLAKRADSLGYRIYLQLMVRHHLAKYLPSLADFIIKNEKDIPWIIAAVNKYELEETCFWEV